MPSLDRNEVPTSTPRQLPWKAFRWLAIFAVASLMLLSVPQTPEEVTATAHDFQSHFKLLTRHAQQQILAPAAHLLQHKALKHYSGEHDGVPLVDFIRANVGPPDGPDGRAIWLTLGDANYVQKFLAHTRLYLDELPSHPGLPQHDLVVLCLDYGCVNEGRKRNMLTYGGFLHDDTRPDFVRNDTWAKANGLVQTLRGGYHTVFFDADVFFRWDVFDHMRTLSNDTWDLQIQEESHLSHVNTGFMFMRSNQKTVDLWQYVLDEVVRIGARDQAKTNAFLNTTALRSVGDERHLRDFVGPTGLRVHVLNPEYFWGMHMGWYTNAETTLLHLTCAPPLLKGIIAGAHGFYKDVDGMYSKPPKLLSLGTSLGGTQEDVAALFRILVAAAVETGRSVVPPLDGHFIGVGNPNDGNHGEVPLGNITHARFLWSLVDLEPLLAPNSPVHLLEPHYPEHATPWLANNPSALVDLHSVRELDLRPVPHYGDLLRRLDQPYYRHARHVRLITDEGVRGRKSSYGTWARDFPSKIPKIGLCASPEMESACGNLCRK